MSQGQLGPVPDGSRVGIIVPIPNASTNLDHVTADLRNAGMVIHHVLGTSANRKVSGDIHPDSLPRLQQIQGIGTPRFQQTNGIGPDRSGAAGPGLA